MSNDVRIGVSADASGASGGLGNVEKSARKVAEGVKEIDRSARQAEVSLKRLESVAKTLSSELGRAIDPKQAEAFLKNFDAIRNNRHISGGSKLRQFDSFEEWHARNNAMFLDQREAERYKRRVYNLSAQGTGLAFMQPALHGAPGHSPYHQQNGSQPPQNQHGAMVGRGMATMKGMVGAGLALAGITSVMAMAGRSVDLARQEATSQDQLLRTVGDLDKTFDDLRDRVRESGKGLGVLYTEAAALGKHYANITNGQVGDIGENLRTGFGLSRAYGLELAEGVSFMGQMRHLGQVKSDDQSGRKLAMMIAESIEKGGNTGKAGEVLAAVSNFSSQVAKLALTAPNAAGFAGALAGLTASHTPGLDPTNAAQILMTADNTIRQGGGMGEAGLNFSYGALSRVMPGLNPILFKSIMGQGAFGSGISGEMSKYLSGQGVDVGRLGLSKASNMELLKAELERQNMDPFIKIESFKNLLGLQSTDHAAALYNMKPQDITRAQRVMGGDIESLTASGLQNVGRIAAAGDADLRQIAGRLMGDKRFSDLERSDMGKSLQKGDMESLRDTMIKAVAVREQEQNDGAATRDAVVSLDNALTKAGGGILPVLTGIQEGVVAMARAIAPESEYAKNLDLKENYGKYKAERSSLDDYQKTYMDNLVRSLDESGASPDKRALLIGRTKQRFASDRKKLEEKYSGMKEYEQNLERNKVTVPAPGADPDGGPIDLGPRAESTPGEAANLPEGLLGALIQQESGGRHYGPDGKLLTNSRSGARGIAQIMPATGRDPGYGVRPLQNDSKEEHMRFANDYLAAMLKKYGGDHRKALAAYNAGPAVVDAAISRHGADWLSGMPSETQSYVPSVLGMADGFTGTMPGGVASASQPIKVEVSVNGRLTDQNSAQIGELEAAQASVSIPMAAGVR